MDHTETHDEVTPEKPRLLEKHLGLWDVYAIATGAALSSGFFLLPGLAAAGAGPVASTISWTGAWGRWSGRSADSVRGSPSS